jgi:hypothetical protein
MTIAHTLAVALAVALLLQIRHSCNTLQINHPLSNDHGRSCREARGRHQRVSFTWTSQACFAAFFASHYAPFLTALRAVFDGVGSPRHCCPSIAF